MRHRSADILIERLDLEDGQFLVKRLNFGPRGADEASRIRVGSQRDPHPGGDGELRVRHVNFGRNILRQAAVPDIADNAYDFAHRSVAGLCRDLWADAFADRVFVRKEAPRERLIDDRNAARFQIIARVEVAPFDQTNAQCAEVIRQDALAINIWAVAGRDGPPFNVKIGSDVATTEGQRESDACAPRPGQIL